MLTWIIAALALAPCGAVIIPPVFNMPAGSWSHGYLSFNKLNLDLDPEARLQAGSMSAINADSNAHVTMELGAEFQLDSFTTVTFTENCVFTMKKRSFVQKQNGEGASRSQFVCDATFSIGTKSYINVDPQVLLNITAPFELGQGCALSLGPSSVFHGGSDVTLKDGTLLYLADRSQFLVSSNDSAVVSMTSDPTKPGPSILRLGQSSRFITDGSVLVGKGKDATVILSDHGYLYIGRGGSFSIQSAHFIIGHSSYWIINGYFMVQTTGTLDSGLQSKMSLQSGAKFNSYGSVILGQLSEVIISGTLTNNGPITLSTRALLTVEGTLTTASSAGAIVLSENSRLLVTAAGTLECHKPITVGVGANVTLDGTLTVGKPPEAVVTVGPMATFSISKSSLYVTMPVTIEQFGRLAFENMGTCFVTKPVTINSTTAIVVNSPDSANAVGVTCVGAR